MTLTIKLFDGLIIEKDGQPVEKTVSRKVTVLLAYLAYEARPQNRETLATLFWDDRTQKQALSNLRTVLTSLRKQVGEYVTITRQTVAINEDTEVWVDTTVFQQQINEALTNWPSADAIAQTEAALMLYTGRFMQGILVRDSRELEDWMQMSGDQLSHLATSARQKLVDYYQTQGNYIAGIQHTALLLQADSLEENTHRQMMQLLARSGQRRGAIEQYEACRRMLDEEFGVEPDDETEALYRRLQLADRAPANNIPTPLTTFVGRTKERLQISALLREGISDSERGGSNRLLTLIGLGGIGKTRLAVQIAHDMANNYLNGVYFVPLAPIESSDFLVSAIAEATNLTFVGKGDPKTQLLNHLRDKEALLVLDNFEHVVAGATLLDDILQHAPDITFLVTSRERLQLRAERLFELGGLPCPTGDASDHDLNGYDSSRLFVERAQLVDVNFKLTDGNEQCVGRICQLLQGMPLGIELAAAWIRAFSCSQILSHIEQNLDFLATQMQDVPERHRSLRAIFDYVWSLLSEDERLLFIKLSLFRGGFEIEAATAVADVSPWTLVALVEKSLLRKQDNNRYEMLEVLRRFAAKMSETFAADLADGRAKHANYYADFLAEQAPQLNGRHNKTTLAAIATELENVHAAWSYAIEQADFDIATRCLRALSLYYVHKGLYQEGANLMETAVIRFETTVQAIDQPTQTQCNLLSRLYAAWANLNDLISNYDQAIAAAKQTIKWGEIGENIEDQALGYRLWGWNCTRKGDYESAITHAKKGHELAQTLPSRHEEAECARIMSAAFVRQGHYMRAVERAQEAYNLYKTTSDRWGQAKSLNMLGIAYWYLGDYDQSKTYYQQALPIYQEIGNVGGENSVLGNLGLVATYLGDYEEANRLYQRNLAIYRRTGDRFSESWMLNSLGSLSIDRVLYSDVLRYCQEAARLAAETGARWVESHALHNIGFAYWCLGEYTRADTYYQQSSAIRDEMKERHGEGISFHDRSLLAQDRGDYEAALTLAQQALSVGETSDDPYTQASALTALGNSLMAFSEWDEAQDAYHRALPIWESLKRPHRAIDTQAGLVKLHVAKGNLIEALTWADEILHYLTAHSIEGIVSPFAAYLACIQILQAIGDSRADVVLAEAKKVLMETAVKIENPSLRASYLENVPVNRELVVL